MTKLFQSLAMVIVSTLLLGSATFAQVFVPAVLPIGGGVPVPGSATSAQTPAPDKIPVKLQFVISRFEGERKVSSSPFTLSANANGEQASLLIGANVPIVLTTQSSDGKQPGTISYTNIGITIQTTVTTDAGRFKMQLLINDKSVIDKPATGNTAAKNNEAYSFRDLLYTASITVKEGETKQIISATDKISGEVVKIDVTLTLDK